jgi:hypothetical protein
MSAPPDGRAGRLAAISEIHFGGRPRRRGCRLASRSKLTMAFSMCSFSCRNSVRTLSMSIAFVSLSPVPQARRHSASKSVALRCTAIRSAEYRMIGLARYSRQVSFVPFAYWDARRLRSHGGSGHRFRFSRPVLRLRTNFVPISSHVCNAPTMWKLFVCILRSRYLTAGCY